MLFCTVCFPYLECTPSSPSFSESLASFKTHLNNRTPPAAKQLPFKITLYLLCIYLSVYMTAPPVECKLFERKNDFISVFASLESITMSGTQGFNKSLLMHQNYRISDLEREKPQNLRVRRDLRSSLVQPIYKRYSHYNMLNKWSSSLCSRSFKEGEPTISKYIPFQFWAALSVKMFKCQALY